MAKKLPEINSSSTADIAFLLLSFFLMTSNMAQDAGLQRRLPPMPDENQKVQNQKVNRRNIITVKINSADRLMAGNEPIDVSMLKYKIKEFLVLHPTYVQHTRYAPEGSTTPGFRYPAPGYTLILAL